MFHTPVLLKQVIEFLAPKSGGAYFDGTLGGGGYSEAILEASSPDGRVVAFDIDDSAISAAGERLERFGNRVRIEKANYAGLRGNDTAFDGMVLDLGVSSFQFDVGSRGFSYSKDAPLDMRMNRDLKVRAADIVNGSTKTELEKIFTELGEERFALRIVSRIMEARKEKRIETTSELEEICFLSYPGALRKGRIHPATKVFQALRIKVNGELENLKDFLERAPAALNPGGRLVIVSYHSLEDRIVKDSFKRLSQGGGFKLLTKKPVVPADDEVEKNPRARSAKLRAICRNSRTT